MNSMVYVALSNTSLQWICCQCELPNFSPCLFEETIPISFNNYSLLSSSNLTSCEGIGKKIAPPTLSFTPVMYNHSAKKCQNPNTKPDHCEENITKRSWYKLPEHCQQNIQWLIYYIHQTPISLLG